MYSLVVKNSLILKENGYPDNSIKETLTEIVKVQSTDLKRINRNGVVGKG